MKALLERCEDMLNVVTLMPHMPKTRNNPSFCDDFRDFLRSAEWLSFMKKQVSGITCLACCTCNVHMSKKLKQSEFCTIKEVSRPE
jgi:Domain of unknown function (DUF4800)